MAIPERSKNQLLLAFFHERKYNDICAKLRELLLQEGNLYIK